MAKSKTRVKRKRKGGTRRKSGASDDASTETRSSSGGGGSASGGSSSARSSSARSSSGGGGVMQSIRSGFQRAAGAGEAKDEEPSTLSNVLWGVVLAAAVGFLIYRWLM